MIRTARAELAQLSAQAELAKPSASAEPSKWPMTRRLDDTAPRRYGKTSATAASTSAHGAGDRRPAERRPSGALRVLLDELAHLIDGGDAAHVALALRHAPGEEPVPAEDDAVAAGLLVHGALEHQRQLETGALPRDPRDIAAVLAVELLSLAAPLALAASAIAQSGWR